MSIKKEYFGETPNGERIDSYTITSKNGSSVKLLELGCIINNLSVPDREGKIENIVCGFSSVGEYLADNNYHGAVIGRFANRIRDGLFSLNGSEYRLARNEGGRTHLHGGNEGFNRKKWAGRGIDDKSVAFEYLSIDGEEGYPGNLSVRVEYSFDDNDILTICYKAESDNDTVINLTNHAYFNLGGIGSGSVAGDYLYIDADFYSELDSFLIPTGEMKSVGDTRYDFGKIRQIGNGYDNNFYLNEYNQKARVILRCEKTGRGLEIHTDMPCIQLYTAVEMRGDNFEGEIPQRPLEAVCLETQFLPDGPNIEKNPGSILKKGERYDRKTVFAFKRLKQIDKM